MMQTLFLCTVLVKTRRQLLSHHTKDEPRLQSLHPENNHKDRLQVKYRELACVTSVQFSIELLHER